MGLLLSAPVAYALVGCALHSGRLDLELVAAARARLSATEEPFPLDGMEDPTTADKPEVGSVVVGELLAIFPGLFVHGLGHYYAGDYQTAARLRHIGEFGYILTAVGGGIGFGAYLLDRSDHDNFAYSLYATGGVVSVAGVAYWLTAWIYDMVDTPRAVRTGGEPPPRSKFVESLDVFD